MSYARIPETVESLLEVAKDTKQTEEDAERLQGIAASFLVEDATGPDNQAEWLDLAIGRIQALETKCRNARGVLEAMLAENVSIHGPIKLGEMAYKIGSRKRVIQDREMLLDFLSNHSKGIETVFRCSNDTFRLGGFRKVAEDLMGDPDVAEDTFLSWEDQPPRLERVYPARTKWAAGLKHKERRR